jgi:AcrR family transcriptional regulator
MVAVSVSERPTPSVALERPPSADRPSSDRRTEILRVAGEVFAERGFATATVREIAERSNILSGSLYHHFASKEAMVLEILGDYSRELVVDYEAIARSDATGVERFRALLRRAMSSIELRRTPITILFNEHPYLSKVEGFEDIQANLDRVRDLWVSVLDAGVADGQFRPDLNAPLVYRTAMGTVLSAVRWFNPAGASTADQIADSISDLIVQGINA